MNEPLAKERKTRAPRKAKTTADIKAQIEKLTAQLATAEQEEHAEQLKAKIAEHNIVRAIQQISAETKVSHIAILTTIGKALKIARLSITQTERQKRGTRGSNRRS